jgi:hypothetical protein
MATLLPSRTSTSFKRFLNVMERLALIRFFREKLPRPACLG